MHRTTPPSVSLHPSTSNRAAWYLIQNLVVEYGTRGFRFYYVDLRTVEQKGISKISGAAHIDMLVDLVEREGQGRALARFV